MEESSINDISSIDRMSRLREMEKNVRDCVSKIRDLDLGVSNLTNRLALLEESNIVSFIQDQKRFSASLEESVMDLERKMNQQIQQKIKNIAENIDKKVNTYSLKELPEYIERTISHYMSQYFAMIQKEIEKKVEECLERTNSLHPMRDSSVSKHGNCIEQPPNNQPQNSNNEGSDVPKSSNQQTPTAHTSEQQKSEKDTKDNEVIRQQTPSQNHSNPNHHQTPKKNKTSHCLESKTSKYHLGSSNPPTGITHTTMYLPVNTPYYSVTTTTTAKSAQSPPTLDQSSLLKGSSSMSVKSSRSNDESNIIERLKKSLEEKSRTLDTLQQTLVKIKIRSSISEDED